MIEAAENRKATVKVSEIYFDVSVINIIVINTNRNLVMVKIIKIKNPVRPISKAI